MRAAHLDFISIWSDHHYLCWKHCLRRLDCYQGISRHLVKYLVGVVQPKLGRQRIHTFRVCYREIQDI